MPRDRVTGWQGDSEILVPDPPDLPRPGLARGQEPLQQIPDQYVP